MQKSRKRNLYVRRSATAWIEIVRGQRESGLTVKAYCAEQAIAESTFWNWRKRIAPLPQTMTTTKSTPTFLPVAITPPVTTSVEVQLGEMRVRLDGHAVAQIIDAIVLRIGAGDSR